MQFRKDLLIIPASPDLAKWLNTYNGQVFRFRAVNGDAHLECLGPEDAARNIPINITSRAPGELKFISNFAETPFYLDDELYGSVEGFWQSLKFPDLERRREIALLHGAKAKDSGHHAPPADTIDYCGQMIRVGTWAHWELMERASMAKFEQNERARKALLSTGTRPLVHEARPDSKTIPGVIMAAIWMRCRSVWQTA
jgi:predicted NAD-dependent protein-ADP-ribosyltransferase YbiA (DUF1768 family)